MVGLWRSQFQLRLLVLLVLTTQNTTVVALVPRELSHHRRDQGFKTVAVQCTTVLPVYIYIYIVLFTRMALISM